MLNYKIIGGRIKELRLKRCLSQEKLAEMCDLSSPHISRIESGSKKVSLETMVKLGNALGVTTDTFLVGFQESDNVQLLDGCNNYERLIIFAVVNAIKNVLRENNRLVQWTSF